MLFQVAFIHASTQRLKEKPPHKLRGGPDSRCPQRDSEVPSLAVAASSWEVLRQVCVSEAHALFRDAQFHELSLDKDGEIHLHKIVSDGDTFRAKSFPNVIIHLAVIRAVLDVVECVREIFGSYGTVDPRVHFSGVEVGLERLLLQCLHCGGNNASVTTTFLFVERVDADAVQQAVASGVSKHHVLLVGRDNHRTATAAEGTGVADVAQECSISRILLVAKHLNAAAQTIQRHAGGKGFRCDHFAVELDGCGCVDALGAHREETHEESLGQVGFFVETFLAVEPSE